VARALVRAASPLLATLGALFTLPAQEWPSFRGPNASGVADHQSLPDTWDVKTGANIRWVAAIPGLAHSSPIISGDRIFVATAVSSRPNATFKPGLYGEGTASEDVSVHKWQVLSLDRKTGKIQWTSTAYEGVPKEKRHIKSTYASSTPATNGNVVVAMFGSQGLYAFDVNGKLLWKKELGKIDAGAYDDASYEWGTASSPIIYKDKVIVQCDQQRNSFLIAVDLKTGETRWRTERDELPSWASPTVITPPNGRPELVTNAPNLVRGYDPETGKELWRLGGSSKITAPTPFFANGLIYVASGRRPEAPIFAIRTGGSGDITGTKTVAWSKQQRGSYMPTPIFYDGLFYVIGNAGIFDCYEPSSGIEVYRERIPHQGSGFSASPVAADGKLYLSSEDGDIFIVRAGRKFELIGKNSMGEPLMATPALADRTMYVRGERHLFAIGR
jgi:outer membrane protein assembly factor BamB